MGEHRKIYMYPERNRIKGGKKEKNERKVDEYIDG